MAANPEQPITNQWGTVSLGLPDAIVNLGSSINTASGMVVSTLNVALTVLDVLKTFAVGYLDPIQAILNAVIAEIEKSISDLDQIGLYLSGDFNLFTPPFDQLKGGYQAYERRMISRLTDRSDPTRPDVSEATTVFGIFLYSSVDAVQQIADLIRFAKEFSKFWNSDQGKPKFLAPPVQLDAKYGADAANVLEFEKIKAFFKKSNKPPQAAQLSWTLSQTQTKSSAFTVSLPGPHAFLVEVSTIPDGIKIFYERPVPDTPNVTGKGDQKVQLRESGSVLDPQGNPLTLHGGFDQLQMDASLQYNAATDSNGNLRKGGKRVYGVKNKTDKYPIPLDQLKKGTQYLFQRTFYVEAQNVLAALFSPGSRYQVTLDRKDLPYEASLSNSGGQITATPGVQPPNYYVRVRSVSDQVERVDRMKYKITSDTFNTPGNAVQSTLTTSQKGKNLQWGADLSEPSEPFQMQFPDQNTFDFLDSLTVALAVLFLSRADLPLLAAQVGSGVISSEEALKIQAGNANTVPLNVTDVATGLEGVADKLLKQMFPNLREFYYTLNVGIVEFRHYLLEKCRNFAHVLHKQMGSDKVLEKSLADQTKLLRSWTWDQSKNTSFTTDHGFVDLTSLVSLEDNPNTKQTILESLESDVSSFGLGLNPWSLGIPYEIVSKDFYDLKNKIFADRNPGFLQTKVIWLNPELKAVMTQEEADRAITKRPQLSTVLLRHMYTVDDPSSPLGTKIQYLIPESLWGGATTQHGSADHSPVFFFKSEGDVSRIHFCRNVIPSDVYKQAATILNVALAANQRPPQDGNWLALRLFTGLPQVERMMKMISQWLKSIKAGSQSVTDGIKSFIAFLQSRILSIQNLIERISAMLQQVLSFNLGTMSALLVSSKGTSGVLSDFVTANNKPNSPTTSYTAGAVILAPSVPSFIVDLFKAI